MKFIDDYQIPYDAEHCNPILPPTEQINRAKEAFAYMSKTICEYITPVIQKIVEILMPVSKALWEVLKTYPNKRVVHLATYGKGRVKKRTSNELWNGSRWRVRNTRRLRDETIQ